MTRLVVHSGACGFSAVVRAEKGPERTVDIAVESGFASTVVLTLINCLGVRAGAGVQNVMTVLKMGALLALPAMALGLGISNKMARLWPGAPAAFAIHEYVSLLGLAFALFHALVILSDKYINFTLVQLLVPFSTADYKPLWVGLGQLGFYTWAVVALSFYIRPAIGQKVWRLLHYATLGMYILALFHGLFSGTDSSAGWAQQYYWFSGASLLFLFFVRVTTVVIDRIFPQKKQPVPAVPPR